MDDFFEKLNVPSNIKLDNFEKYVRRQSLSRFLARYELFNLQKDITGCIIECGVHWGGGLFAWAKLSSALEPYAIHRRIFGFDTFTGFPSIDKNDLNAKINSKARIGGFEVDNKVLEEINELIEDYNKNRFLNQFDKIFLVKGDATTTIPKFIKENSYLIVSLLFCDFDLYKPTKVALQNFLPRMPKVAVLAFDEINNPWWPGETQAILEELNLNKYKINRFSFDPNISYIVI